MMPREQAERTAEALGGEIAAEGTSGDTRSASLDNPVTLGDITTTAADRGTLLANITITSGSRTGTATVTTTDDSTLGEQGEVQRLARQQPARVGDGWEPELGDGHDRRQRPALRPDGPARQPPGDAELERGRTQDAGASDTRERRPTRCGGPGHTRTASYKRCHGGVSARGFGHTRQASHKRCHGDIYVARTRPSSTLRQHAAGWLGWCSDGSRSGSLRASWRSAPRWCCRDRAMPSPASC